LISRVPTFPEVTASRKLGAVQLKAQERIARATRQAEVAALPKPGPCVHRNVTSVVSKADEVVAWLCKSCDAKLPADWSVREEDL
jgi:hypothetical protein